MNCCQIADRILSKYREGWEVICYDGSSFDSTQHKRMIEAIDV